MNELDIDVSDVQLKNIFDALVIDAPVNELGNDVSDVQL